MKISIVTTSFNGAKTIRDTIESILSQKGDFELEYIITDAGSQDGTVEIVRSFGDRIRLIDAKGLNQSAGINLGLTLATGEIVAFLNADDVYEDGALQAVYEAFSSRPDRKWLVGKCRIIDENGKEMQHWITSYKNFFLRNYSYFLLLTENFICQPAVFLRRELLGTFGYFSTDEHYVMDYEYWLRIGREETPIILDRYLASFRRFAGTKSNSGFYQQFRDDLRVAISYSKRSANYFAIPIKYLHFLKTVSIYRFLYRA